MTCAKPQRLDLSRMPCVEQCRALYDAYLRHLTGSQKTTVRHGEQWVEFRANSGADLDKLRSLYESLRSQCPEAKKTLPSTYAAGNRAIMVGRSANWPRGC